MNKLFLILVSIFLLSSCTKDSIEEYDDIRVDYLDNTIVEYDYSTIDVSSFFKLESVNNRLPYLFNQNVFGESVPSDLTILDYNGDGNLDLVYSDSDYQSSFSGVANRRFFKFFIGDSEGNLSLDLNNDKKFIGTIHTKKSIVGDWNNDGYMDMFFASSGIDGQNGVQYVPNDYPIMFLNDKNGSFIEFRLDNDYGMSPGYWHSVTASDIDNDGVSEIILINPKAPWGNISRIIEFEDIEGQWGNGLVITELDISVEDSYSKFTSESIDLNGDGVDELILGGMETDSGGGLSPGGSIVYNYKTKETIRLPITRNLLIDMIFYDLDGDGDLEIICSTNNDYFDGKVEILRNDGNSFTNVTDEYIEENFINEGDGKNWIEWLYMGDFNNDGIIELHTSDLSKPEYEIMTWLFIDNKFVKIN